MPTPINTPHTPVVVHYCRLGGKVKQRTFTDPYVARRFYEAKFKAGFHVGVKAETA